MADVESPAAIVLLAHQFRDDYLTDWLENFLPSDTPIIMLVSEQQRETLETFRSDRLALLASPIYGFHLLDMLGQLCEPAERPLPMSDMLELPDDDQRWEEFAANSVDQLTRQSVSATRSHARTGPQSPKQPQLQPQEV